MQLILQLPDFVLSIHYFPGEAFQYFISPSKLLSADISIQSFLISAYHGAYLKHI